MYSRYLRINLVRRIKGITAGKTSRVTRFKQQRDKDGQYKVEYLERKLMSETDLKKR